MTLAGVARITGLPRARTVPALWRAASMALAVLTALPMPGGAQNVGVRAYLSPGTTVGVGAVFVVNVEITGTQSVDEEPRLPDLSGFAQYLGSSTQSSVQMAGGRTTVSLVIQYRYQAMEEGTFEVPAFRVAAGGQTMTTDPLSLTVSASAPPPGAARPRQGGQPSEAGVVTPDDLFVAASASKTSVREGEPFVVEYRVWTRVDVTSFSFTRIPEPQGFWVEDITPDGPPQVEQRTRDGQPYATALIRRVALVPTGSGRRTIDPIGLEAQVRVRRGFDPFEDFFGRSSLFGATMAPTTVLSNPLTITVEPLPAGRPEPYSGVVGRLDIGAELDRDSVDANEAVTLTVRLTGDGHIRGAPEPELELPSDFEVFPPEVSESLRPSGSGLSGQKSFEYVLIPRAPGRREIPAIRMGYFDQSAGTYRVATTEPLPLTVTGVVAEGPAGLARGGVAELRQDIRYIHLGSATLRPAGRALFAQTSFWLFLFLPLVALAGAFMLRRHQDLLEGDVAYARGRRATRLARKRLAEAKRLAAEGDSRAFYAEVARALRGLIADRLNLPEAGLLTDELGDVLGARGVDADTAGELTDCLGHCDRQRFAPPGADPQEKARFLRRAGDLMAALDRAIR